ncbi:NAD(P)/FAD-dependent oxidoreductase [Halomonas heilongjiangensis]|uniref:Amino acid dehydrogenase n=1 Tax=Halomonas heilongjiangensis TaxID=1387883 RepID=A0A2N7TMD7_9GAMM|nr:FAD-binding oxidoreductase [Halomonas heilongjiangensis]PMR69340.1 amino acid dehydrogenase [Halomonas heilongjiangensis]PXX90655.1 amino acid dehydrogenase [Halomonas heilongjiangensis]
MSREIIVLGAGMVGVSIAWHLVRRGHSVVLVDRREPGRETSFGNAGIIQREAVKPYPFPRDLGTLARVLPNRAVDIRYRLGGVMRAAGPLLHYWQHSSPRRYDSIVPEYASLISLALDTHAPMIAAAGAEALVRKEGWLEVYRTVEGLDAERREAEEAASRFRVNHRLLDADALQALEPHLVGGLAGAIHWLDSWTVADPGALVQAYAASMEAAGGRLMRAEVSDISRAGQGWRVTTDQGALEAGELVLAMGPWSGDWLSRQGISVPLFVKRGYHMHYAAKGEARLGNWVMDAEVGYLLAPMRAGIRLTTGAELARREAPPDHGQLAAAERVARRFFPLGERLDAEPWKGARPCTPDMKPVIGPVPDRQGLWLAFGHGHHGFTLGPATGRLLAEMIDGEPTAIDMAPFRVDRF